MVYKKPKVKLTGKADNGFAILHTVVKALRRAGALKEMTDKYIYEAIDGDLDNLLKITMEYVDIN